MSEIVEVVVESDKRMHIRYQNKNVITVGIDATTQRLLSVFEDDENFELLDELNSGDSFDVVMRRIPAVPQVAERPEPAASEELELIPVVKKPRTRSYVAGTTDDPDRISEKERDAILELIIDSLERDPDMSKTEIAEESHRIAKEVLGSDDHTSVMRVAGVRAALARGVYDYLDNVRDKHVR